MMPMLPSRSRPTSDTQTKTYWIFKSQGKLLPVGSVSNGEKRTCVATWQSWSVSLKKAILPDSALTSPGLVASDAVGEEVADEAVGKGKAGGLMIARAPKRWAYDDAGDSSPHIVMSVSFV
ncbi:uncharacterized protein SPSK_08058 [Sporothrix schenckii 1099-18]|uniref:Uncharacterized protein n=1 Tax=Sporothrix schenckii 1099-18 TaxID=1397361 RepID=A0A0F2MD69_SPOSC|nr:uncharacterized protein SPSK_08058 [Sporothrix schenckii 1099-18]KJR87643.1 hypothetical protein SPSK_08058 [Sporothrix schenckii 1099-18]